MSNFYFTFGHNQVLHKHYVKIKGDSYEDARTKMITHYGKLWAFQYSEEDFEGQPEEYGLTEVRLGTPNWKRF